ncbi:head-tail adaptor protein [Pseudomonas sp. BJa3]|uniref:head-tail adaptor protein n=1 Tax=Pseudomonas sp. BJa3 TaxID=2986525 RepID=UPI002265A79C|nr:head-tail adaptor protein [Pseudomonas sp. BJa3]MCX5508380.1 head-tail adaptor protein [Pseudomonas sp. BJa3]
MASGARGIREPASGELIHRMAVRERVDKTAGAGLASEFRHICMRWVKVEPLGTATYVNAQQTKTGVTHRLYCRFIPELQGDIEFVGRGRVYRVKRPTELAGRQIWSVIEVEELGPDSPAGGGRGELRFD